MYKIAVYTLVNGGITHQKTANIKKCDITRSMTLPKCQCTAEIGNYGTFDSERRKLFPLDCDVAVNTGRDYRSPVIYIYLLTY